MRLTPPWGRLDDSYPLFVSTEAGVYTRTRRAPPLDNQPEHSGTVLLIDEGGCGMGADRVLRGASLSS